MNRRPLEEQAYVYLRAPEISTLTIWEMEPVCEYDIRDSSEHLDNKTPYHLTCSSQESALFESEASFQAEMPCPMQVYLVLLKKLWLITNRVRER